MRRFLIALSTLAGLLVGPALAAPALAEGAEEQVESEACEGCEALLELAVANPRRKADAARDRWRHPVQTLRFFAVRPDMKVGEYAPGGGWYTHILGLYLGQSGHLSGIYFDPAAPNFDAKAKAGIRAGAAGFAAETAQLSGMAADRFSGFTLDAVPAGEAGTYDRILIMRMLHNLVRWGTADAELQGLAKLLKPNGLIGIEQHRAKPGATGAQADGSTGYLRQADVVKLMERNGFSLVAASEINANPKDSADWPGGVWTLPPTFSQGDADRAKYAEIGESDRMTLIFKKK